MASTKSIRQIIRQGLLSGKVTSEIAAELKLAHPTSAAARLSSKHIAWYRAEMVKAGEIEKGTGVEPQVSRPAQVSKTALLEAQVAALTEAVAKLAAQLEQ
jgi:hypothetical protein